MKKLLRVCVAVGLALGVFLLVGCGDDKGVGPRPGGGTNTGGTPPPADNGDAMPGADGDPCDLLSCIDNGTSTPLNAEWKLLKEGSSGQSLAGTTWLWETVTRMKFAEPSALGNKAYTLEFKENGQMITYSYVNQFWGTYTVESRGSDEIYKINIGDFGGTKVADINDSDELWRISFRSVNSFSLKDDVLTLFYNDGRDSLVYIPTDRIPLKDCDNGSGNGLFKKNCGVDGSGWRSK